MLRVFVSPYPGLSSFLRVYGMNNDPEKIARFFKCYGSRFSASRKNSLLAKIAHNRMYAHMTERSGTVVPSGDGARAGQLLHRHFNDLSKKEKGAKLVELAKRALRTDHIGFKDPKDVRVWLIKPGSRKY